MSQRGGTAARPCITMGGQCISAVGEPRKGPHCLIRLACGEGSNNQNYEARTSAGPGHVHVLSFTDTYRLGVAPCQSGTKSSLKKAVLRLWLVSKSRTKSSVEGCE
jgi:hypothetical protein